MNQLTVAATAVTMTSREIADLVDKRHDNVMADIRKMLAELYGEDRLLSFQGTVERANPSGGAPISSVVYMLPKRESLILVSGYSIPLRAKIIDRWAELEAAASNPVKSLDDPRALREVLLGYTEKVIALESKVVELTPKANALDRLEKVGEGSFCLTDAAKDLQVAPRAFTRKLQEIGWIYRRPQGSGWLAYQHRIAQGVLEHKVTHGEKADGSEWVSSQVRVTARGMARLAEIFEQEKAAA